ncbi:MAG: phytoene/squalene synthase family protein [Deltaproteobacteria bacterium]
MELVAAAPAAVARATIAHHSKSFALASRLLGRRVRDQTAVIYTWCRRADDAIDEAPAAGDDTIERLDDELVAAYTGRARDPVLAAFGAVANERRIPLAYPRQLLAGMAMDVRGSTYVSVDDLIVYAWRVAGVVGLMMTHVFGIADEAALIPAAHLGIAMQLTNICRDVGEDARRGRVYLPADLVGELGYLRARRTLLALAARYYRSADTGMTALPWRAALAVRAARNVYAAIGDRITDSLDRAVVSTPAKLALVSRAFGRAALAAPLHAFRRYHVPTRVLELADVPRL